MEMDVWPQVSQPSMWTPQGTVSVSEPQPGAHQGHGRKREVNKRLSLLDGDCTLGQCEVSEGKMGGRETGK